MMNILLLMSNHSCSNWCTDGAQRRHCNEHTVSIWLSAPARISD